MLKHKSFKLYVNKLCSLAEGASEGPQDPPKPPERAQLAKQAGLESKANAYGVRLRLGEPQPPGGLSRRLGVLPPPLLTTLYFFKTKQKHLIFVLSFIVEFCFFKIFEKFVGVKIKTTCFLFLYKLIYQVAFLKILLFGFDTRIFFQQQRLIIFNNLISLTSFAS